MSILVASRRKQPEQQQQKTTLNAPERAFSSVPDPLLVAAVSFRVVCPHTVMANTVCTYGSSFCLVELGMFLFTGRHTREHVEM